MIFKITQLLTPIWKQKDVNSDKVNETKIQNLSKLT